MLTHDALCIYSLANTNNIIKEEQLHGTTTCVFKLTRSRKSESVPGLVDSSNQRC